MGRTQDRVAVVPHTEAEIRAWARMCGIELEAGTFVYDYQQFIAIKSVPETLLWRYCGSGVWAELTIKGDAGARIVGLAQYDCNGKILLDTYSIIPQSVP
ncbi:hypothetical protein FWG76_02260 [Candidatus Saccharibacteria bacterium]|nr:hypothetical protein [Candidatus Saccharibacteria bacterium]